MKDSRNEDRGKCTNCEECWEYEPVGESNFQCAYCGCPPAKHSRLTDVSVLSPLSSPSQALQSSPLSPLSISSPQYDPSATASPPTRKASRKGFKIPTKKPTGPKRSENNKSFTIPTLSPGVMEFLTGEGDLTRVWKELISECAHHFATQNPMNTRDYNSIGLLFFGQYPKIQRKGRKPWSIFTKCLSRKVRKIRCDTNVLQNEEERVLASPVIKIPDSVSIFDRKMVQEIDVNSPTYKRALDLEWAKENPSSIVMKECLKKTFFIRTQFLTTSNSPSMLLELYPCLLKFEWLDYELQLMSPDFIPMMKGNVTFLVNRMKSTTLQEDELSAFCELQGRFLQSAPPVLMVTENHEEYSSKIGDSTNPFVAVYAVDGEIVDLVICLYGKVVLGISNLELALFCLISLYRALMIPYPQVWKHFLRFIENFMFGVEPSKVSKKHSKLYSDMYLGL